LVLVLVLCMPLAALAGKKQVHVYNWTEYIPDEVLADFQKETGIKVIYATFDSNESMYAKIKLTRGKGYDVAFPSTYFVHKMRRENLLNPINKDQLPNFKHLDPLLLDKPYDPANQYSIPYVWGSTGLIYNADHVPAEKITSWKDLWQAEFKNRLVMNDDVREVFGMALILNGYSINDTDAEHIKTAYESLKELLPNIRVFSGDAPKMPMLNLETYAGMTWNGEAYMANQEMPSIKYAYPSEGAIFWVDSMVIPKGARNIEEAHAFINYILRPDVAVKICDYVGFAPANKDALPLMEESLRNNTMIFPSEDVVKKGEFQLDVGEAILTYERYWERLKTGN
ncbi:MAG: spermidine/putrescine ABC transporter substrate-binding protein, partial [Desulfobacterales bacterium]|nr:spermidine/putrescine ABC transporter substrate-binding protein [Desulfobacterales bacterium]